MSRRHWCVLVALVLATVGSAGCGRGDKAAPPAPAAATKSEGDLAYLLITEKAAASLQIKTEKPRNEPVQDEVEVTGWVTVPQGREVTLTAPHAGYVLKPPAGQAAAFQSVALPAASSVISFSLASRTLGANFLSIFPNP